MSEETSRKRATLATLASSNLDGGDGDDNSLEITVDGCNDGKSGGDDNEGGITWPPCNDVADDDADDNADSLTIDETEIVSRALKVVDEFSCPLLSSVVVVAVVVVDSSSMSLSIGARRRG